MGAVTVDVDSLKEGVLGLAIALVEVIKETLELEALRRMEGGSLSADEVERLGEALAALDAALQGLKEEHSVTEAVRAARDGLDRVAGGILDALVAPGDDGP